MSYTVQNLFDVTAGLMNEERSNTSLFNEFVLPIVNTVLSELFNDENNLRIRDGQEVLESAPYLDSLDDTIPYHDELVRNVMPFGLGLYLYLGDDEMQKATYFSSKYDENRRRYAVAVYQATSEVFSDGV